MVEEDLQFGVMTLLETLSMTVKDVCKDTRKEPGLIPVGDRQLPAGANRADGARSDVEHFLM